jgi:hypothetical protein
VHLDTLDDTDYIWNSLELSIEFVRIQNILLSLGKRVSQWQRFMGL